MDRIAAKHFVPAPRALRRVTLPSRSPRLRHTQPSRTVVSVVQPSFWKSLVPKPFRREEKLPDDPMIQRVKPKRSKEWNPATFYIVIFLLIGSMAINMISLRQGFDAFMRQTDVRIGLLKEVVEKLQRGEKVDVEKALGAGNPEKEADWADGKSPLPAAKIIHILERPCADLVTVLKEIEREGYVRDQKKDKSRNAEPAAKPKPDAAPSKIIEPGTVKMQQGTGMSSFF